MEWIAKYNTGNQLKQFEVDGKENLFRDIDQDKLEFFTISNEQSHISLDLKTGVFDLNNNEIVIDELSYKKVKYRLIYFRRVSVSIGMSDEATSKTIRHFIGYQVTIDNKNHKVMFSEQDGKFQLRTE